MTGMLTLLIHTLDKMRSMKVYVKNISTQQILQNTKRLLQRKLNRHRQTEMFKQKIKPFYKTSNILIEGLNFCIKLSVYNFKTMLLKCLELFLLIKLLFNNSKFWFNKIINIQLTNVDLHIT